MANTYSQIIIQLVFAVEERQSLIAPGRQEEVNKYITGIVRKQECKMIAINGIPDHIHVLIGLDPSLAISDLVRDIKSDSSEWINKSDGSKANSAGRLASGRSRIQDPSWTESRSM
jgi:putative transposase